LERQHWGRNLVIHFAASQERIRELRPVFHGDYLVRLTDGTELTLSRSYRDKLLDPLSQFL